MKTGMMEVAGTKYPLSFSARVIVECNKRYGSIDNIGSALESEAGDIGKVLTECFWLLSEMSRAGSAYQKLMGNDAPEPLTEDFLLDAVGVDDIAELKFNIFATITGNMKREVETEEDEEDKKSEKAPKPRIRKTKVSDGTSGTV